MPMMKIRELQRTRGNLHEIIPALVNRHGQRQAADQLGIAPSTVSKWLKDNHYIRVTRYVREGREDTVHDSL